MLEPKRYPLIVFDWDGTLIDSVSRIVRCFLETFGELGLPRPSESHIKNLIGLPLGQAIQRLAPGADHRVVERGAEVYRRFWLDESLPLSPLFPGVLDLLNRLIEQGHTLAVATGKSRVGLEREQRHHKISHLFRFSRCAGETAAKPDPAMLLEILAESGVDAREALMVGDTTMDLEMAHAAGVGAVGVRGGSHPGDRLEACRPLACLDSAANLISFLGLASA